MTMYFFTVTWKGKKYRGCVGVYSMKKAAQVLGVPESAVFRGADSKLPDWDAKLTEAQKAKRDDPEI